MRWFYRWHVCSIVVVPPPPPGQTYTHIKFNTYNWKTPPVHVIIHREYIELKQYGHARPVHKCILVGRCLIMHTTVSCCIQSDRFTTILRLSTRFRFFIHFIEPFVYSHSQNFRHFTLIPSTPLNACSLWIFK